MKSWQHEIKKQITSSPLVFGAAGPVSCGLPRKQKTQRDFATAHRVGLSTLNKWLRLERDAAPAKIRFKEVGLLNPASRWPVEVVSPQGWIVRLQASSAVEMLPELLQALPC